MFAPKLIPFIIWRCIWDCNNTPGKLSQVPPAEVPIKSCDRHLELPVTVQKRTTNGRYSSFLTKYKITGEFIKNQKVLFGPHRHKVCHTLYPPELAILTKDTTFEVALISAHSTQNIKNSAVFGLKCSDLAYDFCFSRHTGVKVTSLLKYKCRLTTNKAWFFQNSSWRCLQWCGGACDVSKYSENLNSYCSWKYWHLL